MVAKLYAAACKGTHLPGPDDDGSDENFVYGGPENADGPAAARPECTNNLKQIALAVHALDAGDPSSFQINSAGADDMGRSFDLIFPTQTAFEQREGNAVATESLEMAHEGFLHGRGGGRDDGWCDQMKLMPRPTAPEANGTGSFIIANVGDPATIDASLVFDSTGGDRSTVLPYIEERATMMKMFMGDYGNSTGASINIQDVILRHGSDATVTDTFDFKGEVTALEPVWTTDGSSTGDTADLWEWRKQVMDGTLKDTFDFQPQLTSEPTAAEAGHVKVFSQVDFNATPHGPYDTFNFKPELTSEPTTSGDQLFDNDGFFVFNRSNQGPADEGPEETVAFYYTKIPDQTFDDLAVDPTNPNTGHTPEWSNLRSGDPGLPAVQKDDAFDFTTEPTEPTATEAYPIKEGLFVFNRSDQVYGNTGDGGIIIEWTTGDGPKGGDTVGVIAIITPTEHGSSILEFSVENFSAFPQPENNAVSGDGGTKSDGQDDGWCMATEIDFPESVHALYDLVV